MTDLGTCGFCAVSAVVVVNGIGGCTDHIDDAMRPVGDVARAVRSLAGDLTRPDPGGTEP